ncbi:MAG: ABC transporter permease subunit [Caldithrix sp.]|nr:ABC transporter permease subunit [Caldithrix sp.]
MKISDSIYLRGINRIKSFWGHTLYPQKDKLWLVIWITGILLLIWWNAIFLNRPAFKRLLTGFGNTLFIASLVIVFTLILSWIMTWFLYVLRHQKKRWGFMSVTFVLNLIRSVPQIVGILFAYVAVQGMLYRGMISSDVNIFVLTALAISLFIFLEVVDLMQERIRYFQNLDFYNAMRVCGFTDWRIINFHILWKNSRIHILNKVISVFGMAVFLQCSVDFIISVGLSTQVSAVNLPTTLGSLLANIDSKQDILAIGYSLSHPGYISNLFFKHLQGLSTAFILVFTLLSVFKISNGFADRYRL